MFKHVRAELPFIAGALTLVALFAFDPPLAVAERPLSAALAFVWLFAAILFAAIGVMRHADHLAVRLGEPLGTILLTTSAVTIEVSLLATIILHGDANPTLARDTMFAVLMIVMNGLVGVALLLGALRHSLQSFNPEGARAFLAIIMPLAVIALVLPNYTVAAPGGMLSPMQASLFGAFTLALYAVFLLVQTRRHRAFFQHADADGDGFRETPDRAEGGAAERQADEPSLGAIAHHDDGHGTAYHAVLLVATLAPVPLIAEYLAGIVEDGTAALNAPVALAGVIIAVLVLAPEGLAAITAARENRMQRSINILYGSALASIALTIPAVVFIGLMTGHPTVLGLEEEYAVLLVLTLVLSMLTFGGSRTDLLRGAVHLILFAVFVVLIVIP